MTRITARGVLPETGYIRQAQLIGEPEVTPEQAEANRRTGKGPKRARPGSPPLIPWSSATLWRKVAAHEFIAPVKLSAGITAWRVEDVRRWIDSQRARDARVEQANTGEAASAASARADGAQE
jgi:prophage regulatory protein